MNPPAPTFPGASSKYLKDPLSQDIADVDKTLDDEFACEDSHVLGIVGGSSIAVVGHTAVPSKRGDLAVAQAMTDLSCTNYLSTMTWLSSLSTSCQRRRLLVPTIKSHLLRTIHLEGWQRGGTSTFHQKGQRRSTHTPHQISLQ
jgi:hypothetical protein